MSDAIERLLAEAEQLPDPQARRLVRALAAALVELVGDGLRRVGELGGDDLMRRLADDDLVGNLLVLCGMHPDPIVERARRALEVADLAALGVTLDGVDEIAGGVRVRVSTRDGVANLERLRASIEAIVVARAPDVDVVQLELGGKSIAPPGFVGVERLRVLP